MNFNQLNEPQSRDSGKACSKSKERCLLKRSEDEIPYYEYGAHFPYQTVYLKLETYLTSISNLKTYENDAKAKKANNVFNISVYDKSRNINLNNNMRQNNIHFNNPKKGITLLLFNKSNVTMQNINPSGNERDKQPKDNNNVSKRKGAINQNKAQRENGFNPKEKIKSIIHQKEVASKKSERVAYSTSHPKKNALNEGSKKEGEERGKEKNSKSNPVPYKRNINTNRQAFLQLQANYNTNNISNNLKKVNESNLSRKQPEANKRKIHNNSNQFSVSSKEKDKKPKPHSANEKLKSSNRPSNRPSHNIIILSSAKPSKLTEAKPIYLPNKNISSKEDKSRNGEKEKSAEKNKEKEKDNPKQLMTFNNIEQSKDKPVNQKEDLSKKPHSLEKPVIIPQMKDVKLLNINPKHNYKQCYPMSRKNHLEVKVNLTSNHNSPSVSKGKMAHTSTNTKVDLPTKKVVSISKYSSRNFSSNKQSVKSTTAKPVLTTKRLTKEKDKLIQKLITSNQETSNSEMKVSPIITSSNPSPSNQNQLLTSTKALAEVNSKNRVKSNPIPLKEGKVHVKCFTSKQSFIQYPNSNNVGNKKQHK